MSEVNNESFDDQNHDQEYATTEPFDPNQIRVSLWTPTIDLLMKRIKAGEIDLAPDFQRTAGIWSGPSKSRLIESILIRIPLPAFYFDVHDDDDTIMSVVDGIQRLSSISEFVLDKSLELKGLEYLKDLEGKKFDGLPRSLQRRIEEAMVTVYRIEKGTPLGAKLNIFKRINTGGEPLTLQEIRHALTPGPIRTFLKELAHNQLFVSLTGIKKSEIERMEDRELVLRFLSFSRIDYMNFSHRNFDAFLLESMRALNKLDQENERQQFKSRFEFAIQTADEIFAERAFRRPGSKNPRINRTLYDAWTVILGTLTKAEADKLIARKVEVRDAMAALAKDEQFVSAISYSVSNPERVRRRFKAIKDIVDRLM